MADANKIPKRTAIAYFKWETPTNPNPRLAQPIGATDTTIYFSVAPKDEDGAVITAPFIFQVTNASGYTEEIYAANGANGTSGLSATGCVRGILPSGIDYTVGSATYAAAHEQDSPVRCSISPTIQSVIIDALTGTGAMQTGGTGLYMGDGTDSNLRYYFANADGSKPYIGYDAATNQTVISNDGVSSFVPGTSGTAITGGDGITVTAGDIDVDLTDTTIFKTVRTGNEARAVVTDVSTGKIDSTFITAAPLATYISDVTSTASEIDKVVNDSLPEFTVGEAINGATTPQACALLAGTMYKQVTSYNASPTTYTLGAATTNARLGQSFVITDDDTTSMLAQYVNYIFTKSGTPSDNIYVEIQSDSGSDAPSGTVITNGTSDVVSCSSLTASTNQNVKFPFSTPPTLVSGTKYWLVLRRSGAVDASNYPRPLGSATSVYSGGHMSTYDSTPGTWTDNAPQDLLFHLVYTATYGTPKLMLADADNLSVAKFLGFTKSNVADGGTAVLQVDGVVRSFPGASFTPGQPYYLSTTAGGLTATMPTTFSGSITPTIIYQVGEAISATDLLIRPKAYAIFNFAGWTEVTTTSGTADILIETGFKPTKIDIGFFLDDTTGSTDDISDQTYFGAQKVNEMTLYSLNSNRQTVTAQTTATKVAVSPFSDRVKVQAVYQNGFLLRFSDVRAGDSFPQLYITIE